MCAFADAVGVAMRDELALKQRLDAVAQRMMHHPVAEWGSADAALLGFVDGEVDIGARLVGEAGQLILTLPQI